MELLKSDLDTCTTKNTPFFTFACKEFLCKCISVYDGDTITVAFKPFSNVENTNVGSIYKYNIRLAGIDTPEIRTKNPDEKKRAIVIRDKLREKILNKFVFIKCGKFDKYGRLLGDVYDEKKTEHINKWLIDNGFAYAYDGGTKQEFKSDSGSN